MPITLPTGTASPSCSRSTRIDGQSDAANKRITSALGIQDPRPQIESGDRGDDDSEQAS
ncbi:MAG TPA: hypothetical protein VHZ03_25980 [Trebonia sp.]|nr:hypothetical protein [Trebonia sp.]